MPLTKIKPSNINTTGVTAGSYTAADITVNSSGQITSATSNSVVASGGGGPKITSIAVTDNSYAVLDDTAVSLSGGYVKITGTGFVTGCQVLVNNIPATSTTFVSSTEVRAQVPATAAGSYIVYLVNTDGGVAIRINGITFSDTPTWVTASSLGGMVDEAISIQLSATAATSYALASGSTLPSGLTLSSSGLLSGTVTGLVNDTSYSFTVNAIDAELQDSPRSFTITISTNLQVARSLRFNSQDNIYLQRTASVAGNRRLWTWSCWVKLGSYVITGSNYRALLEAYTGGNDTYHSIAFNGQQVAVQSDFNNGGGGGAAITTAVYRDPSAWYHIVVAYDNAQSVAADRCKFYVNGTLQTLTTATISQNFDNLINSANPHRIGNRWNLGTINAFDGNMTEVYLIDGQALTPASFARSDPNTGQWIPKRYTGTYGTNGFYLNFSDNSGTTATTLGKDTSGNNNNFTPNNFSITAGSGNDSTVDSPTSYSTDTGLGGEVRGNYCTLNPNIPPKNSGSASRTLANGNLDLAGASGGWTVAGGTFRIFSGSGRWYFETTGGVAGNTVVGFHKLTRGYFLDAILGYTDGADTEGYGYGTDGSKLNNGGSAYGASWTTTDVIGCAIDASGATSSITFYKNGVSQGVAFSNLTGDFIPAVSVGGSGPVVCNFGQRPFAYAAPSGFKSLNTHNLPALAVTKSNTAFDTVLYTGNGSTQTIGGLNFAPDLVWIKDRSSSVVGHRLYDTIRGATKEIYSHATNAETTDIAGLTAFTANGFTTGNSTGTNTNGDNLVAWAWDAGTSTVVNTAGSITANVRATPTSGFSIVSWAGTGAVGTIGHNLGVAPSMIIVKARSTTDAWYVYHVSMGPTIRIQLNEMSAQTTGTSVWNSTSPTSTVFSIGSGNPNSSSVTYVAYCWAAIPGFSAFGSYTGNGSTDGPFVYTGFRPAWILIKRSDSTENWNLYDSKRNTYNVADLELYPNLSNSEGTYADRDFLSNGFKIRNTNIGRNASGGTYIYAAFAEQPFKYSRAR